MTSKDRTLVFEEKARQAEQGSKVLQEKHESLCQRYDEKIRQLEKLESQLASAKKDAEDCKKGSFDQLDTHRQWEESRVRTQASLESRVQILTEQLQAKTDEKILLQTRHDALTTESEDLQSEVTRLRVADTRLRSEIERMKETASERARLLEEESESTKRRLISETTRIQANLDSKREELASEEDKWKAKHGELKSHNHVLEEKVKGLERMVDKLQEAVETRPDHETLLHIAINGERERYAAEERAQARQVDDLQADLAQERRDLDQARSELFRIKEELLMSVQGAEDSNQKLQALDDEILVLQSALDETVDRAKDEKERLRTEIETYRKQAKADREEVCRMEAIHSEALLRLQNLKSDLEVTTTGRNQSDDRIRELEKQLSEVESQKCRLQLQVDRFERDQLNVNGNNLEITGQLSRMQSSCLTPGRMSKKDLINLKDQLHSAQVKVEELRQKLKAETRRNIAEVNDLSRKQAEELQNLRDQLEQQAHDLKDEKERCQKEGEGNVKTISRLRARIHGLEKELRTLRLANIEDKAMAVERQDLHDMVKSAKLDAENLQHQLSNHQSRLDAASDREKNLRDQLQRIRTDRIQEQDKVSALSREMECLQDRYDDKVEELRVQRLSLLGDEQARLARKTQQARNDVEAQDKRHCAEVKGLARQIEWLRAKCQRERGFRESLVYEKTFLSMQIDMFRAWFVIPSFEFFNTNFFSATLRIYIC